ncbi:hypothetical protein GCM10017706_26190 [Lactococcus lactis subsp. hordniae]
MISKLLSNEETSDTGTNHGGTEKTGEFSGNLGGVVAKAGAKYTSKDVDTFSQAFMKSNSETVENVLHDYLIDMLMDNVKPKVKDFYEGDFVKIKAPIEIFDFKTVKESVSVKVFQDLYSFDSDLKEAKKQLEYLNRKKAKQQDELIAAKKLEAQIKSYEDFSGIKDAEKALNILDTLFPETILIKVEALFLYAKKKKFRLPSASLAPISLTTRSVTIFATLISEIKREDTIMPDEPIEVLSKAGAIMPELLLTNLNIKKDGYYNVRPIAIYFE